MHETGDDRSLPWAVLLARLTWLVLAFVFVGLLGGTHPADATRDVVLGSAGAVILAVNLPVCVWLARRWRRASRASAWSTLAGLVLRLAASGIVLTFVGGISHESRLAWDHHDAWRRCQGAMAAWPDEPAPPCRALHMCANEARLSDEEHRRLEAMVAARPGCGAL